MVRITTGHVLRGTPGAAPVPRSRIRGAGLPPTVIGPAPAAGSSLAARPPISRAVRLGRRGRRPASCPRDRPDGPAVLGHATDAPLPPLRGGHVRGRGGRTTAPVRRLPCTGIAMVLAPIGWWLSMACLLVRPSHGRIRVGGVVRHAITAFASGDLHAPG